MAKPSRAKIQPNWILQFVTLIETMGSVVFTWGPIEVELAARPITILSPCFDLDKVKSTGSNDLDILDNYSFKRCCLNQLLPLVSSRTTSDRMRESSGDIDISVFQLRMKKKIRYSKTFYSLDHFVKIHESFINLLYKS